MQKFTHYFFNVFFTGFCCAYLIFILENMTWRGLSKKTFLTLLLPLELLLTMIPGTLLLKLVFSEIRVRTWVQKNRTLDWLTSYLVYQLKACFLPGNHLNSCPYWDLRKNWIICTFYWIIIIFQNLTFRFKKLTRYQFDC